jgi:hypothetical protein
MKNITFLISLVFTFGIFANAQSSKQIAVHVPFDFYVRDQKMPAGDYLIESAFPESIQSALIFRQKDGKAKKILITLPIDLNRNQKFAVPTMLFNRYGDSYFLTQIRNPYESLGFTLPTAKSEKLLAGKSGNPTQETVVMSLVKK